MRIRVWGCRGSLAAPGPHTVRYGGNTSCVEVRLADGTLCVLDAGTGIRPLGLSLGSERLRPINLLLTHLHLDHLEGLGFFAPLWDPEAEIHVFGPPSPTHSLRERITAYFSPPLFPVHLSAVPARLEFHDVPDAPWELGSATLRAGLVEHPGPTVAYRFEERGRSFAYVPDHEPALSADLRAPDGQWVSGLPLVEDVELLFHDSQYTEEEYGPRVGWGHSSVTDTVAFARLARARRLALFHHDPGHSDVELEAMLDGARRSFDGDGEVSLAAEGLEIELA